MASGYLDRKGEHVKRLLIIKTGTTFPSIRRAYGDFDDMIMSQADLPPGNVMVSAAYKYESLPDLRDVSAIIITGAHSMVTDNDDWLINLSWWLRDMIHESVPVLGICYGHQLLAKAFGGCVDYHPKGKEIGTVSIDLTEQGKTDPLLSALPETFLGHVTHAQTVITLPSDGRLLAKNDYEKHHAFSVNENIWGVQFHPEFNAAITRAYIDEQKDSLVKEGYDLDQLHNSVREHKYGKLLLRRFMELFN